MKNISSTPLLVLLLLLLCSIVLMVSSGEVKVRRKLKEDEVGAAILSTIMGSSSGSRLMVSSNKTASSALALTATIPEGEDLEVLKGHPKIEASSRAKQDAIINRLWGGNCKLSDWTRCHNISTWGGDYVYKDKEEHFEMECTTFRSVCMRNGWSVNRCHLLCMGICNRDLLITRSYDRYVSHDGNCEPLSKKL